MKKFLVLALAMLCSIQLFASRTWYSPYSAAFFADLKNGTSSTGALLDGTQTGIYGVGGDYSQNEMVGTIGVVGGDNYASLTGKYTVSFDFDNVTDWTYVSQSDRTLRVPFGLDIVFRYRVAHTVTRDTVANWAGGHEGDVYTSDHTLKIGNSSNGVLGFGYTDNNSNTSTMEVTIDTDDTSLFPLNPDGKYDDDWYSVHYHEYSHKLVGLWIDIVLVLGQAGDSVSFPVGAADDYMASFNVNVNGITYPVVISGVYEKSAFDGDGAVLFTVTPNSNSYNIKVADILGNVDGVTIGEYFYTGDSVTNVRNPNGDVDETYINNSIYRRDYSIFVSSSDSPTVPGKKFVMMHNDVAQDAELNERNGFYYMIKLKSTAYDGKKQSAYYDGTATLNNLGSGGNGPAIPAALRIEEMIGNDGATVNYYDQGDIIFTCYDEDGSPVNANLNLVAGSYSSTVYLHFISEL